MKILHTSDWHLGRTIYGRRCTAEFQNFLRWLVSTLKENDIECLLIAGDIFDTTTPSNAMLRLYYSFLHEVSQTGCRHVVITGGNHDSPSLLNAPRELLKHLHIDVIGRATEDIADEVITLYDTDGNSELIVCAVPYLRDSDVRKSEPGESIEDKADKLIRGIVSHYHEAADIAVSIQQQSPHSTPIIGMGHLFTAGGKISDSQEIRDLYVGTLAHVQAALLPDAFDYLALGHLHICQSVGNSNTIWYSGSPLQLAFSNSANQSVNRIDLTPDTLEVTRIEVPPFLQLERIQGDSSSIIDQLEQLKESDRTVLVEIDYSGFTAKQLQETIQQYVDGSDIEILRVTDSSLKSRFLRPKELDEKLEDMDAAEVFTRCLDEHEITGSEREELKYCFNQIVDSLFIDDELGESA